MADAPAIGHCWEYSLSKEVTKKQMIKDVF